MFSDFSKAVHARFAEMSKGELFVVDVADIFEMYLSFFPEGTNPIFRVRTEHDCQCCKQFVRRLGNVVAIKDGQIVTVWDNLIGLPRPYDVVAVRMGELIRSLPIKTVFRTKERKYGLDHNYDTKTNARHDHFYGDVADKHYSKDPDTKRGEQEAIFQVLRRGLTEIQASHLDDVLDLIDSNGLYRGGEHREAVVGFRDLLRASQGKGNLFVWENLSHRHARFRNTVIGTLLVDLAEGKDLEQAVKSFEQKVAPMNYKRPTAVITQKMVEQAVETLNGLGLMGAIQRRFARLSDVSVNDVLFVNNASRAKMKDGVAAILESSVKKAAPDLKHATTMKADEFISTVLPTATALELLVQNRHSGNFVSLTGGDGPERLFKWNNNFAWSYDGDVTDSVKQRVKAAGGNIEAKLRVSLSWFNMDDLDLHCYTPDKLHVHFRNKLGILDVDMNAGYGATRTPVENLAFNQLTNGVYKVLVNQYAQREKNDVGFAIEVEFGGVVHQHSYAKAIRTGENIDCYRLHVKDGQLVKIETDLVGGSTSQEKWGVKTETLVPVSAMMYSPNHWGDQKAGAKHVFFILEGCKNPGSARGIYNEFLRPDLGEKHRKVFEVLGAKTKAPYSEDQISGLGFTSARDDSVTIVVNGRRAYTLVF